MAHIAILIDSFVGHFFPTLGLSRALTERGHRVQYLGVPDVAPIVREQGCDFTPILEDALPAGASERLRQDVGFDPEGEKFIAAAQQRYFGPLVNGQGLDRAMRSSRPDAVLMLSFLGLEALAVHYRYALPVVLLTPFIRDRSRQQYYRSLVARLLNLSSGVSELVEMVTASGRRLQSLNALADILLEWPELALYSKAFAELPGHDLSGIEYIGVGRETSRHESAFPWEEIDPAKPIVYCSLGSRPGDYGDVSTQFFAKFIQAMADRPEWQVILSGGTDHHSLWSAFSSPPPNVMLRSWTPQVELIRRAAVVVTHAGMGAVNECILAGVPMVAFPMARDQHENAARIVHHGLGVSGDAATVTAPALSALLAQVMGDDGFQQRIALMRQRTLESDVTAGVRTIEQTLAGGNKQLRKCCGATPHLLR